MATTLTLVIAALAVVLSQSAPRLIVSQRVAPLNPVALLKPGSTGCQLARAVPPGTGRLKISAYRQESQTPPLEAMVRAVTGETSRGRIPGGWSNGPISIPVAVPRPGPHLICFHNLGTTSAVLAGRLSRPQRSMRIGGTPAAGRVSVAFLSGEPRSWWRLSGSIERRLAVTAPLGLGRAAVWVALALVLLGWVLAIRLALGMRDPL